MKWFSARLIPGFAMALAALLAACGTSATPSPALPTAGPGSTVKVTLQEWAVVPDQTSVAAGAVTFEVTNSGPDDPHEFVIVDTDLAAGSLPTDETGTVLEDGEGMTVVNEIEDIEVGATEQLQVSLDPGNYVLICNIYDDDEQESHYKMGMHIAFTVGG